MEDPYYLVNFQCVLEDVRARCADLLRPGEAARLEAFLGLSGDARRLYVRMLTRKGPWFRPGDLAYPEIGPGALGELAETGFLAGPEAASRDDLAALLRKAELEALLAGAGLPFRRAEPRADLAGRVPEALLRASADAVAPLGRDWARLLFLLFFGNLEQDLTDFVLAELGHVRYEAYAVDPACRPFRDREEVDLLLSLDGLRDALEAGEDLAGITAALLAMEGRAGIRSQRRYHRMLAEVGRTWERRGSPDAALACFGRCALPPARERTARIHLALGRPELAAATALEMAEAPLDVAEERFAGRFLRRLARHDPGAARWAEGHPPDPPLPEVRLRVARHPSGSVELAALEASGWEGFHTENTLWTALYGLAFWDVLFAPVPGAFQHRFQLGPADLRTPQFALRRREAIEARFAELEAPGAPRRLILARAEEKRGIANAFVNWKALGPGHLEAALATLPQPALLAVLRAMAPNPAAFRSGFPDLFLHREGRCMVWEVKGPGDALRPEQERWIALFNRAGLDARVAWVRYLDGEEP